MFITNSPALAKPCKCSVSANFSRRIFFQKFSWNLRILLTFSPVTWSWVRTCGSTKFPNPKELSLCHKLWIYNPYIFGTQCHKSLIFQTYIIWSNRIHTLKYLRSTTLESKDIEFRKAEFVAKTQVLWGKSDKQTNWDYYSIHIRYFKKGTPNLKGWKLLLQNRK